MEPHQGKIVIAGGTGFLGQSLACYLIATGRDVIVLGRHTPTGAIQGTFEQWDGRTPGEWKKHLHGAAALINLAGRSVDCIKSPDNCDEILRSRVESTRLLGDVLQNIDTPPTVWVQMATAHIYGDPPTAVCDENAATGYGLAPTVGRAWEEAYKQSKPHDMRGVVLRTSFVLGRSGGALTKLGRLAKLGLGGTIGHGRQGISWIHETDMNRLFERAISDSEMSGMYNATAPRPVSNREFMRALRRAVRMPIGIPAPVFGVALAAKTILRTDPELALYGRYIVSKRLSEDGFVFKYMKLDDALSDIYRKNNVV